MNKQGFTLLELLTVMAIIAIIGGVALVSYVNLQSGGRYLSLQRNIQNQVQLARQQAILQNKTTCLVFSINNSRHEVAVCFLAGILTSPASSIVVTSITDAFFPPPPLGEDISLTLYNIRTGKRHDGVTQRQEFETIPFSDAEENRMFHSRVASLFSVPGSDFARDDPYGFLLTQPYRLPNTITFTPNQPVTALSPLVVYFDGNGTMFKDSGLSNPVDSSGIKFQLSEIIRRKEINVKLTKSGALEGDWKGGTL